MKIIDISIPVIKGMVVWPKSAEPCFKRSVSDLWIETEIGLGLHTGTHIDAPLHRIKGGSTTDKLPLEAMVGPVFVAFLPKAKVITSKELDGLHLPGGTERLLFKTSNSNFWAKKEKKFQKKFVGLSPGGASWLVENKIKLIGNDYLSVAKFDEQPEVHEILLKNKIILLEGLDLSKVKQGVYQLICLPLKLAGTEAAPVRAILVR